MEGKVNEPYKYLNRLTIKLGNILTAGLFDRIATQNEGWRERTKGRKAIQQPLRKAIRRWKLANRRRRRRERKNMSLSSSFSSSLLLLVLQDEFEERKRIDETFSTIGKENGGSRSLALHYTLSVIYLCSANGLAGL